MGNQDNINTIIKFMPPAQRTAFLQALNGSEHQYFEEVINRLTETITSTPAIYGTDGLKADEIKPILHYFGGNVDIYLTEIDTSEYNQHYGYTSLGFGYLEGGYVELEYVFDELPLLNLDLHFTPETIATYKRKHEG